MPRLNSFTRTLLALAIAQVVTTPALAATIVVDVLGDISVNDEFCTLREAVISANTDELFNGCSAGTLGMDTITFTASAIASGTITLSQASPLTIENSLTINGPGQNLLQINGNKNAGVFDLDLRDESFSLNDLTISGGLVDQFSAGGAISGQQIYSDVYLTNTTISGNSAGAGGGIFLDRANLTLTYSSVNNNHAFSGEGGGILMQGGLGPAHNLIINNSSVSNNASSVRGGGISTYRSGSLTISNSNVTDNSANAAAGGIYARFAGSVTIDKTTISNNQVSTSQTGGLQAIGTLGVPIQMDVVSSEISGNRGSGLSVIYTNLTMTNSTLSNNTDSQGLRTYQGTIELTHNTITGNTTSGGAAGMYLAYSNVALKHNIISGNVGDPERQGAEIYSRGSTFSSTGPNLLGDSSQDNTQAFKDFIPTAIDITATNVNDGVSIHIPTSLPNILKPLAPNGGLTMTHALAKDSPAIDVVNLLDCALDVDQRGKTRPFGEACDLGAFEVQDDGTIFVVPLSGGKAVIFEL